jgi:AraC-like DNA-binding protein
MLAFLSVFGIFLSLLMLYHSRRMHSSVYLSLFFLFSSLYALYQYILLYSKSVTLISLFLINMSLAVAPLYLIGPLLYWYVRSVLTDDSKLTRSDIWHFLPMVIYFTAALPEAFLSWNEKVELARRTAEDAAFLGQYQATILSRIFPQAWVFASRLILIMGYAIWSIYLFISYVKRNKLSEVFSKQQFMQKWISCLLGFLLVVLVTQIPMIFKSFEIHFSEYYLALKIVQGISTTGLIGLLVSPYFFPSILYGLPRVPHQAHQAQPLETVSTEETQASKTPRSTNHSFETEYLKTIELEAMRCMEKHKPYLDPGCNLFTFSKLIDIPAHHLAYYFREVKRQRFNDYRNEWRVNHAKALIQEGKAGEITLEAIGLQSGFSSRNAFITDFKKVEGVSPGAFASRSN